MGGATAIALGLALARPDRRVLCMTGDGELLMNVGIKNFHHFLNGAYSRAHLFKYLCFTFFSMFQICP